MMEFVDFKPARAYVGDVQPFALLVRGQEHVVAHADVYFVRKGGIEGDAGGPACQLPGAEKELNRMSRKAAHRYAEGREVTSIEDVQTPIW